MSRIPLRPLVAGAEFLGLPSPPDWASVFGTQGPRELEIVEIRYV